MRRPIDVPSLNRYEIDRAGRVWEGKRQVPVIEREGVSCVSLCLIDGKETVNHPFTVEELTRKFWPELYDESLQAELDANQETDEGPDVFQQGLAAATEGHEGFSEDAGDVVIGDVTDLSGDGNDLADEPAGA